MGNLSPGLNDTNSWVPGEKENRGSNKRPTLMGEKVQINYLNDQRLSTLGESLCTQAAPLSCLHREAGAQGLGLKNVWQNRKGGDQGRAGDGQGKGVGYTALNSPREGTHNRFKSSFSRSPKLNSPQISKIGKSQLSPSNQLIRISSSIAESDLLNLCVTPEQDSSSSYGKPSPNSHPAFLALEPANKPFDLSLRTQAEGAEETGGAFTYSKVSIQKSTGSILGKVASRFYQKSSAKKKVGHAEGGKGLLVFAGEPNTNLMVGERFCFEMNSWTQIPNAKGGLESRSKFATVKMEGNRVLMVGGKTGQKRLSNSTVFESDSLLPVAHPFTLSKAKSGFGYAYSDCNLCS